MAKQRRNGILNRLLGKKIVFNGKFDWGQRDRLVALAEAQQAIVLDDLDASADFLVLADASAGKTIQKKLIALNSKGAAIQMLDAKAFEKMFEPTEAEVLDLIRGGKDRADILEKAIGKGLRPYQRFGNTVAPLFTFAAEKFDGLDLSGFDFGRIGFTQCTFASSTLADVKGLSADACDFTGANAAAAALFDIGNCRFTDAKLSDSTLHGSIANADFTAADLQRANVSNFGFARGNAKTPPTSGCVFAKANLRAARFLGLVLDSPNFDGADLSGASFAQCELNAASFERATLAGASLVGCELAKADFTNADLRSANLSEADLTGAYFVNADLADCNLCGATLDNVDLSKAKNYDPNATAGGTVGPALTELDSLAKSAGKIEVSFRVKDAAGEGDGDEVGIERRHLKYGWGLKLPPGIVNHYHGRRPSMGFSDAMLQLANMLGHRIVRYETIDVQSSKSSKSGKELRELLIKGIAEAFAQPIPPEAELVAATKTYREQVREQGSADRERRETAKRLAEKESESAKKKISKKIAKEVGKVTDIATFLKALELRIEKPKIDKATKMLKASGFQLYNDSTDTYLTGVVKSQTDPDLVYACRIESGGTYACCTQNLNICGGLRGSICKHLLVLIIGLVKAGELDPTTIDDWVAKTQNAKPELNKETMGEIFIRYKGAEAGEVDWRPTETVPGGLLRVMSQLATEFEELRIHIERLRALLDNLVVRGLRACGPDEIGQLQSFEDHLEQAGAGHVAAALGELRGQIQRDERSSARALLHAQTSVRLLERLLTLRVVQSQFEIAAQIAQMAADGDALADESEDADDEQE